VSDKLQVDLEDPESEFCIKQDVILRRNVKNNGGDVLEIFIAL
jgi:hypothetical protein